MTYTLPPLLPGVSSENEELRDWLHEVYKTTRDLKATDSDLLQGQDSAYHLARTNHTGTQNLSTISDSGALAPLDTVGTTEIDDDAVTYPKMQDVTATDRLLGRDSAGAGIVEEITPAAVRTMINVEDGATADQDKADIDALNIDADTLDGIDSLNFARTDIAETFTNDITVQGNVIMANGKGIDFSATPDAAGSTSELLDDYEEGEWTPTYEGASSNPSNITYDNREGWYTKNGDIVAASFFIGTDALTVGSGFLKVTGLPFVSIATGPDRIMGSVVSFGFVGSPSTYNAATPTKAFMNASNTFVRFWRHSIDLIHADAVFMNTGVNANRIYGTMVYKV